MDAYILCHPTFSVKYAFSFKNIGYKPKTWGFTIEMYYQKKTCSKWLLQLLLYSQFKSYFSQIVYNEQSIYDVSS